jgi:hypothetical protein
LNVGSSYKPLARFGAPFFMARKHGDANAAAIFHPKKGAACAAP